MLVADDNSPDGTGKLADELAAADDHVHVLHRAGKEGLGAAYLAGFGWALERGYDVVVEMDADGSHAARAAAPPARRARRTPTWCSARAGSPAARSSTGPSAGELLSRGGNLYARLALGVPLRDATGGYRAFRRETLDGLDLDERRLAGLLLPGRPRLAGRHGRASGSSRCRSRSSSASTAPAR